MADNTKGSVSVPYAVLAIIVTVMIALASFAISKASDYSARGKQVEVNTKVINEEIKPAIKSLEDTKLDKDAYILTNEDIKKSLEDIKGLLYTHMGIKK